MVVSGVFDSVFFVVSGGRSSFTLGSWNGRMATLCVRVAFCLLPYRVLHIVIRVQCVSTLYTAVPTSLRVVLS